MTSFKTIPKFLLTLMASSTLTVGCGVQPSNDSQSLQAGSSLQNSGDAKSFAIINDEITGTIASKMKAKCVEMFTPETSDYKACERAADGLARELDFDYIRRPDGNSAFVFLGRRLKTLLADPAVGNYLNELQRACLDAIYANQKFNLWNFTLSQSAGREDVATERLAVLFQDGAQTAAQRKYLLVAQHPMAFVLDNTLQLLETGLVQGKITAYPETIQSPRTALYHYYVPKFLAQRLKTSGHSSAMAARLPSVFNAVYELRQIQKSEDKNIGGAHKPVVVSSTEDPALRRFVDKWNRFDELYSDLLDHMSAPLKPFNPQGQEDNLQDLYLGYAGGLHGVKSDAKPLNATKFTEHFSKDPASFLKSDPQKL